MNLGETFCDFLVDKEPTKAKMKYLFPFKSSYT